MSIEAIEVGGPRQARTGYATISGVELDVVYFVFCPLGHAVGRRTHVLDLCHSDGGMATLTREANFQCPECGVCFGLTDKDVKQIGSCLATLAEPAAQLLIAVSDERETPCPGSSPSDSKHCYHWYDDEGPCCYCGDDASSSARGFVVVEGGSG